jgi:CheY-like chemotaxis protein
MAAFFACIYNSMNIFVLEDNSERIDVFNKQLTEIFPTASIFFSIDAKSAKNVLKRFGGFDIMLLDHDLGSKIFVNSQEENTGYQVAKFIVKEKIDYKVAICHSMNPVGSENISAVLPGCKKVPFPMLFNYLRREGISEVL